MNKVPLLHRPCVAVAMSGGVDSSVAAALLAEKGYRVFGVTMKLWCYAGTEASARSCCSLSAIEDAKSVSSALGIPHYVLDFESCFDSEVVSPFCSDYLRGRTPNPCVVCNSRLKFDVLLDRVRAMGADFLATGHYAIVERTGPGAWRLRRAADRGKDQSYVLWGMEKERLPGILFPLGEMTKKEVRAMAGRLGLRSANRPESQDVCFVESGSCGDFVSERLSKKGISISPGQIVDVSGKRLGTHEGLVHFTIGQRHGLGVSSAERMYVVALRPETNTLVVGRRSCLLGRKFECGDVNWITYRKIELPLKALVQVRYTHEPALAVIRAADGTGPSDAVLLSGCQKREACGVTVCFEADQSSITPGQSAVFYLEDEVIGGGVIEKVNCAQEESNPQPSDP